MAARPRIMVHYLKKIITHPFLPHLLTMGGFVLAVFLIARLLSEKRQPSNTFAWLLIIVLVPYVGVPLYLLLGGRKLRRLMARKTYVLPNVAGLEWIEVRKEGSPTMQAIVSAGSTRPVANNAMRLLTTGEATYAALVEQIKAARHSIHITIFILGRDETGREIVELLAERARAGVKVRVLLDAVGCMFSSRGFVQPIRDAGGEVSRFMPVFTLPFRNTANLRNHRKMAIFDQHMAIVGGHNIAREYMGREPDAKRWQDFGALLTGPAVALLNEVFLADWSFASGQSLDELRRELRPEAIRSEGQCVLQVVASGPDVRGDPLYEGILSLIQEARETICIVTPYFIPDEVLWRSLMVKAHAGVQVMLVVPAHSNHPITDYARRTYTRDLRKAGVRVMHYTKGMMHSKAVIVDERIGLLGSANFDLRSLFVNFEIGVLVYSEPEVKQMRAWLTGLLAECEERKEEQVSRVPFFSGLVEDLCRLLAPLL